METPEKTKDTGNARRSTRRAGTRVQLNVLTRLMGMQPTDGWVDDEWVDGWWVVGCMDIRWMDRWIDG